MSESLPPAPEADEFADPLEDYGARAYADAIERALGDETADAIRSTPYAGVAPDTPIHEAVQRLAGLHVGCLLIERDRRLVGIFTERDVLDRVALDYDKLRDRPVSEVMTKDPVFVYESDTAGGVLHVMAVSGHRHVPVLALDGRILGVANPRRVTGFLQEAFERS